MDTSGDWSDEDSVETVTEGVFKQHLADSLMALDHLVEEEVLGKRSGSKATKGKGNMARASRASATPTPSSSSTRGTTPLSYVSMAIDRSSPAVSLPAPSSPSPATHRLSVHDERFIAAFKTKTELLPQHGPIPVFTALSERVLDFIHLVLTTPALKDHTIHGPGGISSFEIALAQIIASTGPPPPEAAAAAPPPPPAQSATRPRPADVETAVTLQKAKRVKFQPAPPINPAASKKRAPAPAVAAPPRRDTTKAADAALKPAAPAAPSPSSPSSSRRRRRRRGKHTAHGPSRRGIKLTPPAGSSICAKSITPDLIREINSHLGKDIDSNVILEAAFDIGTGIFLAASAAPSPPNVACVLKHVCRLLPVTGLVPIKAEPATSTSFLKVADVPLVAATPREWQLAQRAAFNKALALSPVGSQLSRYIKHAPRFMRTSPHADTCVAWVDISDTVSGATAKTLVSKYVAFGDVNCQIRGAAPRPGSALCTRCLKWGHHSSVCRSKGIRCSHCGGPHSVASHNTQAEAVNWDPAACRCVNCSAAKKSKANHSTTDTTCPFWEHRFDRDWLKRQRVVKKQQ
jgi:hypothetical protein